MKQPLVCLLALSLALGGCQGLVSTVTLKRVNPVVGAPGQASRIPAKVQLQRENLMQQAPLSPGAAHSAQQDPRALLPAETPGLVAPSAPVDEVLLQSAQTDKPTFPVPPSQAGSGSSRDGSGASGSSPAVAADTPPAPPPAQPVLVWGPQQFLRIQGQPDTFTVAFTLAAGDYILKIANGEPRVSSARLTLDGVEVASPRDFSQAMDRLEKPVTLATVPGNQRTLIVRLASKPGSFLTVSLLRRGTEAVCQPFGETAADGTIADLQGNLQIVKNPCQPVLASQAPGLVSLVRDQDDQGVPLDTVEPAAPQTLPLPSFRRGERIAYVSQVEGQQEIFLADPDGTAITQVTRTAYNERSPVFAPDARALAFASDWLQRGWEMFLVTPTGRFLTRLTFQQLDSAPGDWSSQGELAFTDRGELYISSGATQPLRPLLPGIQVASPSWSPDGSTLAFVYQGQIAAVDPLGRNFRLLIPNAGVTGRLDWAPDNSAFVFARDGKLYSVPVTGGNPLLLSAQQDSEPAWSPDSTRIAFTSTRSGRQEIWMMDAGGGQARQLTSHAGPSFQPAW